MKVSINKPYAFSEIGKKENQEDCIYPDARNLNAGQTYFILCDGMGGHEHGEVASSTVCQALSSYFEANPLRDEIATESYFKNALESAYDALDLKDNPDDAKKMGTTMTCLIFHKGGYLVAHIGDSRIYHIRPSLVSETNLGILYRTSDHSLVNSLLKAGEITEEEAKTFPQKNVITRAMQPNQDTRAKADVYVFSDLQQGDYFFMCCDGVLENLEERELSNILSDKKMDDAAKLLAIKSVCDGRTRDNYTAVLVPVGQVLREETASEISDNIIMAISEEPEITQPPKPDNDEAIDDGRNRDTIISPSLKKKETKSKLFITVVVISFVILAIGYFAQKYFRKSTPADKEIELPSIPKGKLNIFKKDSIQINDSLIQNTDTNQTT